MVVSIGTTLAGMGVWTLSNRRRVEETRTLARNVQFAMMRARGTAIGDGFQRRLSCTATACSLLAATTSGMGTPAGWNNNGQLVQAGTEGVLWAVDTNTDVGATSPSGPIAGTKTITFYPDGTSDAATVFVTDVNSAKKYKVFVYSATAMPRMVDSW